MDYDAPINRVKHLLEDPTESHAGTNPERQQIMMGNLSFKEWAKTPPSLVTDNRGVLSFGPVTTAMSTTMVEGFIRKDLIDKTIINEVEPGVQFVHVRLTEHSSECLKCFQVMREVIFTFVDQVIDRDGHTMNGVLDPNFVKLEKFYKEHGGI